MPLGTNKNVGKEIKKKKTITRWRRSKPIRKKARKIPPKLLLEEIKLIGSSCYHHLDTGDEIVGDRYIMEEEGKSAMFESRFGMETIAAFRVELKKLTRMLMILFQESIPSPPNALIFY